MDNINLRRELQKILEAVDGAVSYHVHDNEKNAALHCSNKTLYSPLTVKLQTAQHSLEDLIFSLSGEIEGQE